MKRSNFFWGLLLVLLGVLFLLKQFKIIQEPMDLFFPIALMIAGLMVLFRRWANTSAVNNLGGDTFSIPLENASRVDVSIDHGGGEIRVDGNAAGGIALSGANGAGLEKNHQVGENGLGIELKAGPTFLPFMGPESGEWHFSITPSVPVSIEIEAGASSLDLDLSEMKLVFLRVQIGAASVKCQLPKAAGRSLVEFESGMTNIELIFPPDAAGRIRLEQGASSVDLDLQRFKLISSNPALYQSDGFDTAENKVEVNLEGGANNIKIR